MPSADSHEGTILQDIVNAICDDEDIRAVSFVGSNTVSKVFQSRISSATNYCHWSCTAFNALSNF